jgi:ABC-type histidine transport system ATPase subunit
VVFSSRKSHLPALLKSLHVFRKCSKDAHGVFFANAMEAAIKGWQDELVRAHDRIADLLARSEVRERSLAYLECLLSGCERKNSWRVAEWVGDASPFCWSVRVGTQTQRRRG